MIKNDIKNLNFLQKCFKEYYFNNFRFLESPSDISRREFGFMTFDSKMIRHISFNDMGQLNAFLLQNVPAGIYCSNSCYDFPTFPINEKRWIGSDLIFDIDLKDLTLPCQIDHTYYICRSCDNISNKSCLYCSKCKSTKIISNIIPCQNCVRNLKNETHKLISFLVNDFGIDNRYIYIYFSGNNGFHITAMEKDYFNLDSKGRNDLVEYIMGKNFSITSLGVTQYKNKLIVKIPLSGFSYGWRKRISKSMKLYSISNNNLYRYVRRIGGYSVFKREVEKVVEKSGVKIDPYVTMDIHRVFRMPGSINNKSGLSKIRCNDLESFDPFSDACLFEDDKDVNLNVKTKLEFRFKRKKYNLDKSSATVPSSVGIYLILKNLANLM